MRILFDQGTPVPLREHLGDHTVATAFELGWSTLKNGELLAAAEVSFDMLITTDQQIRYQQNLEGRRLAILVLPTTSWPRLKGIIPEIRDAIKATNAGDYQSSLSAEEVQPSADSLSHCDVSSLLIWRTCVLMEFPIA